MLPLWLVVFYVPWLFCISMLLCWLASVRSRHQFWRCNIEISFAWWRCCFYASEYRSILSNPRFIEFVSGLILVWFVILLLSPVASASVEGANIDPGVFYSTILPVRTIQDIYFVGSHDGILNLGRDLMIAGLEDNRIQIQSFCPAISE